MADADAQQGTEDQSSTDTDEATTDATAETDVDKDDGKDSGKDEAKPDELTAQLRAREAESAKYRRRAQAAEKELEKFREAQKTEQERAIDAARKEGLAEGSAKGNSRLIRAAVIEAAAGKVADASDAFAILTTNGTLEGIEVGEDGDIDTGVIKTAIDDLVKAKPHLAVVRTPGFGARTSAQADKPDADMDAWIRGQAGR